MKKRKYTKKILVMGLPGSGKTTLARELVKILKADWLNADKVRSTHNDWDFSLEGITRQVKRMSSLAKKSKKNFLVADFVCPYDSQINIFKPHKIIWMDTIKKGRFSSMNKIFSKPKNYDLRLKKKELKINLIKSLDLIKKYKWSDSNNKTVIKGFFSPLSNFYKKKIKKGLIDKGQVLIIIKNVKNKNKKFYSIKKNIDKFLTGFKGRYKINYLK